jgi:membrane associated rhomboid family serine protease
VIPLRDSTPSGSVPYVTISIIVLNSVVWLYEVSLGPAVSDFILQYGLIPVRFLHPYRFHTGAVEGALTPLFSSIFMHGGWMHIIGNMWFLWIFGDNIEDRLGHARFAFFYLLCGVGAALIQVIFHPASKIPMVGASGAISGVLGAYLVSYPTARIYTLFIFFFIVRFVEIPAFVYLLLWFLFQLISGAAELGAGREIGGVAYWAHMGGFIVGIFLLWIMPTNPARRTPTWEDRRSLKVFTRW